MFGRKKQRTLAVEPYPLLYGTSIVVREGTFQGLAGTIVSSSEGLFSIEYLIRFKHPGISARWMKRRTFNLG